MKITHVKRRSRNMFACMALSASFLSGAALATDIQVTRMDFYPAGSGAGSPPFFTDTTVGALVPGSGTTGFVNATGGLLGDTGVVSTGAGTTASGGFSSDVGPTYNDGGPDGFFGSNWYAAAVWSSTKEGPNTWSGTFHNVVTNTDAPFDYTFNLAPGDVAFGLYFDWGDNQDIPVLAVFHEVNPGVWAPVDTDGDGAPGTQMQTAPFPGQTPAFSAVAAVAPDTTPDSFDFADQSGVAMNTPIISAPVTISGINVPATISIDPASDPSSEYELNGSGTFVTADGTVHDGDTVRVRHLSSSVPAGTVSTTIVIGGVSRTFTTTATAGDPTPDDFTDFFVDQTDVATGAAVESNVLTVSGIDVPAPISVAGSTAGSNSQYCISTDGGTSYTCETTDGTVVDGNLVKLIHTTATTNSTQTNTVLTIGGISDTFTSTTAAALDATPDPFNFIDQSGVPTDTQVTSDPITVTGINTAADISVTDGFYSINGGPFVDTPAVAAVNAGDQVRVRHTSASTEGTVTSTTLTIGGVSDTFRSTTSGMSSSGGSNFTMLDKFGNIVDGTNDVSFGWDGTLNTDPATAVVNATLSSPTGFFGPLWIAHHVMFYEGGRTYVIFTGCPPGQPACGSGLSYTVSVAADEIMVHMLFDWSGNTNIDVINVYKRNQMFSPSPMHEGAGGSNSATRIWDFMSSDASADCPGAVDQNGLPVSCAADGINGIPMIDGPFKGFNANFNLILSGTTGSSTQTPFATEASESKKMPGCTISTRPIGPLERGDWWLVAGFIGWLAWVRRRAAHRQSLH